MSTSGTSTTYLISSINEFDQTIVLSTERTPTLTDAQAFGVASGIATALGASLGTDITIGKSDTTSVGYTTDYSTGTFS